MTNFIDMFSKSILGFDINGAITPQILIDLFVYGLWMLLRLEEPFDGCESIIFEAPSSKGFFEFLLKFLASIVCINESHNILSYSLIFKSTIIKSNKLHQYAASVLLFSITFSTFMKVTLVQSKMLSLLP